MRRPNTNRALREKLPTLWRVPDDLWPLIRGALPPEKPAGTPGRPCIPFRRVLDGVLHVLRSGCHWNAVPAEFGSGSTVHRRFQEWTQAGLFREVVRLVLTWYDRTRGIDWTWMAADTKMAPAPLGGAETGPNPTDRGKSGTKRHSLIDGRGVPLSFYLSGANRHDIKGLKPLLGDGMLTERPEPTDGAPQHLCLDKAYAAAGTDEMLGDMGIVGHVKRKGAPSEPGVGEPVHPARRWKAERSISWLNNLRKLRVRWEKKAENYEALWLLGAALITYRRTVLG